MAEAKTWDDWLPGLQTLRRYQLAWLRHDVLAGLVLALVLRAPILVVVVAEPAGAEGEVDGEHAIVIEHLDDPGSALCRRDWGGGNHLLPGLSSPV